MRIKDHLGKISWSFIDKGTYLLFGFFTLYQLKFLAPSDFAYYESMALFNNWIFLLADGLALNGLIQFGGDKKDRPFVNFLAFGTIFIFAVSISIILFASREFVGEFFDESSFAIALSYLPIVSILTIPRNYSLKILTRELKYFSIFILNLVFFGTQVLSTFYFLSLEPSLNFIDMIKILISGALASTLISLILIRKDLKFKASGRLKIKRFLSFGFVVSQQQIFHSIPKIFDFHIITFFFGAEKAGIYAAAKKLYKTFDEAASAAHGLIYPSSVKLIFHKNWESLRSLTMKSLSALLFVFASLIIILNLGLTKYLIELFEIKRYYPAIGIFNKLVLAGLFLPFALLTPLLNALSKEKKVLWFKIISMILSIAFLVLIGNLKEFEMTAFTIVVYNLVLGALCFVFVKKELNLKFYEIFRFAIDIKNIFKK